MVARYSLLLSALWLTILCRTSLGEDMISETQKLAYPFTSDGRLQLSNQNGSVQIVGDDINEVRIEATKKARSQSELAAIRISVEQKEKLIAVKTIWDNISRRRVDSSVEYRIVVPRVFAAIEVITANGAVSAKNLDAETSLRSANGAIDAENVLRPMTLESLNGSVSLTQSQNAPAAKLSTTNGSITLTLPSSASVAVNAQTKVGKIQSDLPDKQRRRINVVGEELQATLGGGANPIQLRTVNGIIRIETGRVNTSTQ
jgi:DUF4097 and DUF4098 domain-containing protein YvlB